MEEEGIMELDKTTLLSVIVCVAGLMSEIIFHDALAGSIPGIVLGIVIGIIVIVAAYFTIDGIITDINNSKEKEWNKKKIEEISDDSLLYFVPTSGWKEAFYCVNE